MMANHSSAKSSDTADNAAWFIMTHKQTHNLIMSFLETASENLQNYLYLFLLFCEHPRLWRAAMSPVVIPQALPWLVYGGIVCGFGRVEKCVLKNMGIKWWRLEKNRHQFFWRT